MNDSDTKVLEYGLNFAIAPSRIPLKELMCSIEKAVTNLSEESADQARQDCALILRHAKPTKPNLSKEERTTLFELRKNQQIKIVKADKGNATVVLDTIDYNRKMLEHLSCWSYRQLSKTQERNFIEPFTIPLWTLT